MSLISMSNHDSNPAEASTESSGPGGGGGDPSELFEQHRAHLMGLAYRLLGSWSEAEDLVQETYLRWHRSGGAEARSPRAWLTTVLTRLGIDQLRSARRRREEYVGPWLPEPVRTGGEAGLQASLLSGTSPEASLLTPAVMVNPEVRAELGEALSLAFLRLLEDLGPAERAVFLLRQVFDYDYVEIAAMLERSEASCRQLLHRAKQRVARGRPRFTADAARQGELLERFLLASTQGELEPLVALLADDAILYSDGGGKVAAALNPIYGAQKIARFMVGVAGKQPTDLQVDLRRVNGQPAAVGWSRGRVVFVTVLEVAESIIQAVQIVRNPDKLGHLGPPP